MTLTLLEPLWLALAIPLGLSLWLWPMPSRLLVLMRSAVLAFLLLGMADLAWRLPSRAGTVVVVADRSRSMPGDAAQSHVEAATLVQDKMGGDDRLAVVAFGETVAVEHAPQVGGFNGFVHDVGPDASNLHDALQQALSLIPPGAPGRILLLCDGRWTGRDPAAVAALAAARGVAIDHRLRERPAAGDVAIAAIDAPATVAPRETYMITAWVHAPVSQEMDYEIRRGNARLAAGRRDFSTGLNRLTFRDVAESPATVGYTIRITPAGDDPVPDNNVARLLVGVEGPRPLVLVTQNPNGGLAPLFAAGGLEVKILAPAELNWSIEDLSSYAGVILEEVPANLVGDRGMQNLAQWVRHTASGLMMTGGQTGYGPGGYYKSPLESILPVSMELRREHRKHRLAIVVALDRSGSMMAPVGGNRRKIDLANLGTAQVLEMLSPMDEFGVLAVDSQAHLISPLALVTDPAAVKDKILRIDSMGGGIFVFEALSHAADLLLKAEAATRHIILFSDAADSEEPGRYVELLEQCRAAGITCSVIGLGTEADVDANLLKDIAQRGGGRIYFTENAEELPRLFAQDTFVVARSTFIDEPTPWRTTPGLLTLINHPVAAPPPIGGYNLTYLRDGANLAAVTGDEYRAPVVASWYAESGRVVAYTAQADGKFTGDVTGWVDLGNLLTGLGRWVAGENAPLPDNMVLMQHVREGVCHVTLHLDPDRRSHGLPAMPAVTILRGTPGQPPAAEQRPMTWLDPDTLGAAINLRGTETMINTVKIAGQSPVSLPPVTLPYSPEFRPPDEGRGRATLKDLSRMTGGVDRASPHTIWTDMPKKPRMVSLRPWLLLLAAALLLAEVLERRTGALALLLTGVSVRLSRDRKPQPTRAARPRRQPTPQTTSVQTPVQSRPVEQPAPPAAEPAPRDEPAVSVVDAMAHARRRAQQRTSRSDGKSTR